MDDLWNKIDALEGYKDRQALYLNHLLQQYKLYVEMADRISSRRNLANVFFLTLNSTVLTIIGFAFEKLLQVEPAWIGVLPLAGALVISIVWWWLIRSYRNLNTAKYKVIGQIEQKLPCSPWWSAEWKELGEGKDWRKYLPLTVLEQYVPIIFFLFYLSVMVYVLAFLK